MATYDWTKAKLSPSYGPALKRDGRVGATMSIVRQLNWMIAVALVAAGFAVIKCPFVIDQNASTAPTSAATFAGALFGAGALFLGNQINEYWRRYEARDQLKSQQICVRAILDNEFVRVCVNHIQYGRELLAWIMQRGLADVAQITDLA